MPDGLSRTRHGTWSGLVALQLAILLAGCNESAHVEAPLARIGDSVITADEFRLNYEFGHAALRQGPEGRRNLLHHMIAERILALEAEKAQLDTLPMVRNAVETMREEILVERVFDHFVLDQIQISDEEIRNEINRRAVRFAFRFLPAAGETDALGMRQAVLESGWESVLEDLRTRFSDVDAAAPEMTSPLTSASEIDPGGPCRHPGSRDQRAIYARPVRTAVVSI